MRKAILRVGVGTLLLAGVTVVVRAQGPPPPGPMDGPGAWMGGPMSGMFEMGGLMGGFGGKVVTGKPILAAFTIVHTQTLPDNTISTTTTGTYARGADGSTYRDVKLAGIGPWAASGKVQEFAYIRNVTKGMQYIVNVTKGTYREFPIVEHNPPQGDKKNRPTPNDEAVTDNPNASYADPAASNMVYQVDDRKVTRIIPAGTIGNQSRITITSERWYSDALEVLMEASHSDPRFGTTTYQLSNIGQSPAASLFTPDPSFTQVQGHGRRGEGNPPPPPPQD